MYLGVHRVQAYCRHCRNPRISSVDLTLSRFKRYDDYLWMMEKITCTLRKLGRRDLGKEVAPGIWYLGSPMYLYVYRNPLTRTPFRSVGRCERREKAERVIRQRHALFDFVFYR
jgi:hypothetical protein